MSPALFWLISNLVPWTQSDRDLMDKFSDQITLFSDSQEQETIGQRDITQKVIIYVELFSYSSDILRKPQKVGPSSTYDSTK